MTDVLQIGRIFFIIQIRENSRRVERRFVSRLTRTLERCSLYFFLFPPISRLMPFERTMVLHGLLKLQLHISQLTFSLDAA